MAAPRFFVPDLSGSNVAGDELTLPDAAAHHALRVLRMGVGDAITLFTGNGGELAATIVSAGKREARVRIERVDPIERESPLAPPIPSFASLRAPRRSHPAMDVLLPPAQPEPLPPLPPPVRESPPVVAPRPAEWPDLLWFSVRVASVALRLPGVLVREPARRLLRLLGE